MTRTDPLQPPLPHVAIDEYATGVLSPRERAEVERHLEECAECRAELAAVEKLRLGLRGAYDDESGPAARVRAEVFAQIDAEATTPGRVVPIGAKRRVPSLPRWAQLAAVVLILVQAGLLIRPLTEPVAGPDQVVARGLSGQPTRLLIAFNPNATAAQMRELLQTLGAKIVDGPAPSGEYRIELSAAANPKELADRLSAARSRQDLVQSLVVAP